MVTATNEINRQMETIKTTILTTANKTATAIEKLADNVDFLASLSLAQPAVADLVSLTYLKMAKAGELLKTPKEKKEANVILPKEIFEFFNGSNHYDAPMEKYSKFQKCEREGQYELDFEFSTLTKSKDIILYKSDAFEFYNLSGEQSCLFTYKGPEFVLFNATSDCMMPISSTNIINDAIRGIACSTRRKLDPATDIWDKSQCIDKSLPKRKTKQVKHINYEHIINCQGTTINTNHEEQQCPDHCFAIPETESFSVEDYH